MVNIEIGSLPSRFETAERLSVTHLISCALACTSFGSHQDSYISKNVNYIYKAAKCQTNEFALN